MSETTQQQRYWCHPCGREVSVIMAPEPTCQQCNGQFVEETGDQDSDLPTFLDSQADNHGTGFNGTATFQFDQDNIMALFQQIINQRMNDEGPERPNAAADQEAENTGQQQPRTSVLFFESNGGNGNTRTQNLGTGGDAANIQQSLLQLFSTIVNPGEGMVGNPDDYVFSQNALDNIMTQLMEQAGGRTAPPPAPEEAINELKKRGLTKEELDRQADCAVCKDEFSTTDCNVIELPCQHIFHDDCIKPWLKMNGTCPVCRKSLVPDSQSQENETQDGLSTQPPETRAEPTGTTSSSFTTYPPTSTPVATAPTQATPAPAGVLNLLRGLSSSSASGWPGPFSGIRQRVNIINTSNLPTSNAESDTGTSTGDNTNQRTNNSTSTSGSNQNSSNRQQERQQGQPSDKRDTPETDPYLDLD